MDFKVRSTWLVTIGLRFTSSSNVCVDGYLHSNVTTQDRSRSSNQKRHCCIYSFTPATLYTDEWKYQPNKSDNMARKWLIRVLLEISAALLQFPALPTRKNTIAPKKMRKRKQILYSAAKKLPAPREMASWISINSWFLSCKFPNSFSASPRESSLSSLSVVLSEKPVPCSMARTRILLIRCHWEIANNSPNIH